MNSLAALELTTQSDINSLKVAKIYLKNSIKQQVDVLEQVENEKEEQSEEYTLVLKEIQKYGGVEIPDALEKRIKELTSQVRNGRMTYDFSGVDLLMPVEEESVGLTSEEGKV